MTAAIVLGLDVGTTAVKAVAFTLDSPDRVVASREHPLLEPTPGHQVQDPATVLATVDAVLRELGALDGEVVALALSAASHGLVGTDAGLRPTTALLTWADARGTAVLANLADDAAWLHQHTGTPVHPMSPLVKLRWYARHDPATAARTRWWLGLKDLVLAHLTGQVATELSSASGTGLLDRWRGAWSPRAAEAAQVDPARLPPVLATDAVLPLGADAAARVGLPAGLPVVVGAADGPSGNVGCEALGSGVAGLSLGTSGAIRLLVDRQPETLDPALFCYALDATSWVVGGAVSNGGSVTRWLAAAVAPDLATASGPAPDARLLELAAGVPAGSDGLVMLPYLLAERAPLWDPAAPGAYLGLRRHHTRGHLVRAAVEGVALQLGLVADRLDAVAPFGRVHATGGAFRARLWGEVLAGTLGRDVVVSGGPEGTARGAAALAVRALGLADDLPGALARLPEPGASVTYRPDPADTAAYARVAALVPRTVASLEAVARLFSER